MALIRATPLKNFLVTALSTSDVSTGYQLTPLVGQQAHAALHLTSAYASTQRLMSMVIQSATASAFGAPVARMTFLASTAEGGEWQTAATLPSTNHSWWRASWTMSTAVSTGGTWRGLVNLGLR